MEQRSFVSNTPTPDCSSILLPDHSNTSLRPQSVWSSSLLHYDFIRTAHLDQSHRDGFGERGRDVLADEVSFDGQLAMASIHQDRKLDSPGPAKIVQRIHCRPNGAPAEEHIIYQHDGFAGHIKWNDRRLHVGGGPLIEVVAVHADIQTPCRYCLSPNI